MLLPALGEVMSAPGSPPRQRGAGLFLCRYLRQTRGLCQDYSVGVASANAAVLPPGRPSRTTGALRLAARYRAASYRAGLPPWRGAATTPLPSPVRSWTREDGLANAAICR